METWHLDHPSHGRLEAYVGWSDEICTVDPRFPEPTATGSLALRAVRHVPALGEARRERLRHRLVRDARRAKQDLVLTRDGTVCARLRGIRWARMAFANSLPDDEVTANTSVASKPRIEVMADPLGRYVTDIHLKSDDDVVALTPPEGSPAALRHAAMDASPWKRIAFPLIGGLGKSGWAIALLVLGPIVSRILAAALAFLAQFLPDIDWPDIPWPRMNLPRLPRIPWPDIDLPHLPLPHWTPPDWVIWLLDHPKVWGPILLALFWGISASRSAKKSRAKKDEWAKQEQYARLAAGMREVISRRQEADADDESRARASVDQLVLDRPSSAQAVELRPKPSPSRGSRAVGRPPRGNGSPRHRR